MPFSNRYSAKILSISVVEKLILYYKSLWYQFSPRPFSYSIYIAHSDLENELVCL